ncbi:aromatic compound dioxygenase [Aspergillus brunneoviolaceus CBS 621.78]|uniref:Aromatic compound dioxygenase n=1 Tax=Aspergillus brunneoviolaceus CBS 621.78 TaxID=1450534 RepID=A0ACD1GPG6_9EURO|nr:aromatic compound dioxygenase [Aspergillus brunneoviolaceus CBS 621.78]RAH51132.1 aromatic compound dioxygenase [Aspergillus brunneoviolaceus CBS 621.78]
MHLNSLFILFATAALTVTAHPGPHKPLPPAALHRRTELLKRCPGHAATFNQRRMAARDALTKRWGDEHNHNATYEIQTEAPFYETIQNKTCVLIPEVTRGPYVWPRSQTLRQDITKDQVGVPLWLDVGVLDMATCAPLPNALMDFWHCNATGSYSSFTGLSPNTPSEELFHEPSVTNYDLGTTDLHTDDTTWLRGMWPTDERGHTVSTGQIYFAEELEREIMALEQYGSHTQINRTTNAEDSIFSQDTTSGYNPVVSVVPADGKEVRNGMIGISRSELILQQLSGLAKGMWIMDCEAGSSGERVGG